MATWHPIWGQNFPTSWNFSDENSATLCCWSEFLNWICLMYHLFPRWLFSGPNAVSRREDAGTVNCTCVGHRTEVFLEPQGSRAALQSSSAGPRHDAWTPGVMYGPLPFDSSKLSHIFSGHWWLEWDKMVCVLPGCLSSHVGLIGKVTLCYDVSLVTLQVIPG